MRLPHDNKMSVVKLCIEVNSVNTYLQLLTTNTIFSRLTDNATWSDFAVMFYSLAGRLFAILFTLVASSEHTAIDVQEPFVTFLFYF